ARSLPVGDDDPEGDLAGGLAGGLADGPRPVRPRVGVEVGVEVLGPVVLLERVPLHLGLRVPGRRLLRGLAGAVLHVVGLLAGVLALLAGDPAGSLEVVAGVVVGGGAG